MGPVRPADALAYRFIGRYRRSKHRKSLTSLHAKRHLLYVSLRLLAVNCLCKGGEKLWFKFTINCPSGVSTTSFTDVVYVSRDAVVATTAAAAAAAVAGVYDSKARRRKVSEHINEITHRSSVAARSEDLAASVNLVTILVIVI